MNDLLTKLMGDLNFLFTIEGMRKMTISADDLHCVKRPFLIIQLEINSQMHSGTNLTISGFVILCIIASHR